MQTQARHSGFQHASCIPRTSLSQAKHSIVDTQIKELRSSSRRLQLALGAHSDESQVLERLYYKGKNQHRGALFWRRVVEVRRYSSRLSGMHIDNVINILRYSFFGIDAHNNPKLLKGSWTHLPDTLFVRRVWERLSACSALVGKMYTRLLDAHRYFTLAMQPGAFLQLVLTLLALVSRLGVVCLELQDTFQAISDTIRSILSVISAPEIELPVQMNQSHVLEVHLDGDTDAGQFQSGSSTFAVTATVVSGSVGTHDAPVAMESVPLSGVVVQHKIVKNPSSTGQGPAGEAEVKSGHRKKRRRIPSSVKDEIDEIFSLI